MPRGGGKEYECPNCTLRGTRDIFLMEKECPECGNQYLYESEDAYKAYIEEDKRFKR
jgi:DNA-directed RNA polymerase subunit RPC12/RpoP